jgi:hypothetical protein
MPWRAALPLRERVDFVPHRPCWLDGLGQKLAFLLFGDGGDDIRRIS